MSATEAKAKRQRKRAANEVTQRAGKKTAAKRGQRLATEDTTNNRKRETRPPKRRKPEAPQLPEKTKRLILKGFQLAYDAHHGKRP